MPAEKQQPLRFPQVAALCQASLDGKVSSLAETLDKALEDAARRVTECGGSAGITLKLFVKSQGAREVMIGVKGVDLTLPERRVTEVSAFIDRYGHLVEDDPRQAAFDFPQPVLPATVKAAGEE